MTSIKVVPLGAGQDVGRSCVLVTIGGKNIMFDCGMHMGFNDERRFPNFKYISSSTKKYEEIIDAVVITHFHLDHCGSLPYFTEVCGYAGKIYMTHPTRAICPILLEDYRKIMVERRGETNFFTSNDIKNCMKKVIPLNLHQSHMIEPDFEIKPYYAGHVLGAAMFYIRVGNQSVVYTGDYNMTPDRHLGSAAIDKCKPDLLITETTYATTIRDSKRTRERDFLKQIHDCVDKGGKVLIPVFALGRAQELSILLETYWDRMNLKVPIYYSAGLTQKANMYYKLFINWTNQKIKSTFHERNLFDFKHISPMNRSTNLNAPGPMVLFATPGMLHAGTSLQVFKHWAPNPLNMIILPGYCVSGTVGAKLLAGQKLGLEVDKFTVLDVKCTVKYLSFSAHADAKGIMQLISHAEPKNVMLVHGEKGKMAFLKERISREFGIGVYDPPNETSVTIPTSQPIPVDVDSSLISFSRKGTKRSRPGENNREEENKDEEELPLLKRHKSSIPQPHPLKGVLVMTKEKPGPQIKLLSTEDAITELGLVEHALKLSAELSYDPQKWSKSSELLSLLYEKLSGRTDPISLSFEPLLSSDGLSLTFGSIQLKVDTVSSQIYANWNYEDDEIAESTLDVLTEMMSN